MIAPDLTGRFPRSFFTQSTLLVAESLVGAILVHDTGSSITVGRIVETEAYLGPEDKAAHTYAGRLSQRNRAMFGPKGHAYIFQIYGVYWCLNCVSGAVGEPQAVLIRALEPLCGEAVMRERLGWTEAPAHTLCRGPGKLCKAMAIDKAHYGLDLRGDVLFVVPNPLARGEEIGTSRRLNIDYAEEFTGMPWRFYLRGSPAVSGPANLRR